MRRLTLHKIHYHGTWESPKTEFGVWHVEKREKKFFCFYNNNIAHHMYEGKASLEEATQFCDDHYQALIKETYLG